VEVFGRGTIYVLSQNVCWGMGKRLIRSWHNLRIISECVLGNGEMFEEHY
jgi:hypothetical protein